VFRVFGEWYVALGDPRAGVERTSKKGKCAPADEGEADEDDARCIKDELYADAGGDEGEEKDNDLESYIGDMFADGGGFLVSACGVSNRLKRGGNESWCTGGCL
jgi:hypothetical protein